MMSGDAESTAGYLVERVRAAPARLGSVRLVCIDGPAGSGKTTLATRLGTGLGAQVLHMDDVYEGWTGDLLAAWTRLRDGVLAPLATGAPGRYQLYDWEAGRFAEWNDVPVADALVVEGCGSAPRAGDALASLVVWVEAPKDVRIERGIARDGVDVLDHWMAWMEHEEREFARQGTRGRAQVVLDGLGHVVR